MGRRHRRLQRIASRRGGPSRHMCNEKGPWRDGPNCRKQMSLKSQLSGLPENGKPTSLFTSPCGAQAAETRSSLASCGYGEVMATVSASFSLRGMPGLQRRAGARDGWGARWRKAGAPSTPLEEKKWGSEDTRVKRMRSFCQPLA